MPDSHLPGSFHARPPAGVARVLWHRIWRQPKGTRFALVALLVRNILRAVGGRAPQFEMNAPDAQPAGNVALRSAQIAECCRQSLAKYRPRVYPGRVAVVQGTEPVANNWLRSAPDAHNGWQPWVGGGLEIIPVAAQHHEVFVEPIHPEVVQLAVRLFREVQARHTA